MLLEKTYKLFARNGANLDVAGKERLRTIDKKMGQLSLQFGENVSSSQRESQQKFPSFLIRVG